MKSKSPKKASKSNAEARKRKEEGSPTRNWPKALLSEIRRIREGEAFMDRGSSIYSSNTIHGLECTDCGEVGQHICLPKLFGAIAGSEEFKSYCWEVYVKLLQEGAFDEIGDSSSLVEVIWE